MNKKMSSPLPSLVDSKLVIQKARVASEVRQTHLFRNGIASLENDGSITTQQASKMLKQWEKKRELPALPKNLLDRLHDPETDELHEKHLETEHYIDGRIDKLIENHPAYPWFSRIRGVGNENIANVLGPIDIERADTPSKLWKFCGRAPENGKAPRKQKGKKLSYNAQLRSMTWRLGVSIHKAGLRQKCDKCSHLFGSSHDYTKDKYKVGCPKCGSTKVSSISISEFAGHYLRFKDAYRRKITTMGSKIIPTPTGRFCPKCGMVVKAKDTKYCPNVIGGEVCETLLTKKQEPKGIVFEAHVHNYSMNKMIKLFLLCLWLYWREALGLPVGEPYSKAYAWVTPEALCDYPKGWNKKSRRKKSKEQEDE